MSITAKALVESSFATAANVVVYTAPPLTHTIVDKFTALNSDASARTLSINIIPSGGTVGSSNLISSAVSIAAGAFYDAAEMKNQVLNPGDQISVVASVAGVVSIRVSGREVA